jgi:hypothetical protein
MKKLLVTLDINYTKEITDITYPYMKSYADRINAEFKIITERKFKDQPVNIEKFQLYDLSKDYDWTIFIDADALIHPNCPDVTEVYEKDNVIFNGCDLYPVRFKPNNYTRRDKRNIGACTWFTVFSDWTRHLWKPYKNPKEYIDQINLMNLEKNFGYSPEHILDDYLVSRNIAKYGLKVKTVKYDMFNTHSNITFSPFFIHEFCIPEQRKIKLLKDSHNRIQTDSYLNYINLDSKDENLTYL